MLILDEPGPSGMILGKPWQTVVNPGIVPAVEKCSQLPWWSGTNRGATGKFVGPVMIRSKTVMVPARPWRVRRRTVVKPWP